AAANATSSRTSSSSALAARLPAYTFFLALYCGVPRDQDTLAYYLLPDAYEQGSVMTVDDIYRVDVTTGHIDPVLKGSPQAFDVTNVRAVGAKLFFMNRYDQKLYS